MKNGVDRCYTQRMLTHAVSHGERLFLFLFRELGEVHLITDFLSPSIFVSGGRVSDVTGKGTISPLIG